MLLEEAHVQCPYCGESFATTIDCSAGDQQYTEDCHICCRPIVFDIECDMEGKLAQLNIQREND